MWFCRHLPSLIDKTKFHYVLESEIRFRLQVEGNLEQYKINIGRPGKPGYKSWLKQRTIKLAINTTTILNKPNT